MDKACITADSGLRMQYILRAELIDFADGLQRQLLNSQSGKLDESWYHVLRWGKLVVVVEFKLWFHV